MTWIAAGIDPGKTGAVAILRDGVYFASALVNTGDPHEVREALGRALYGVDSLLPADGRRVCGIEQVGAMPGEGRSSLFKFGFNTGCAHGVAASTGWPIVEVSPADWYRMALRGQARPVAKADKKRAVLAAARQRWPTAPLARVKDGAVAEALWVAWAAAARMGWVEIAA